ncbi:MAG: peptide-methionine (R)-S-oxide reductase MsrB [Rhodospirillaceae bacterium]|nr:peptide-methionine (R)-S-oxide reductase MsrB [Rhodospirillaceae bacterium]
MPDLSPERRHILEHCGTEPPFSSPLLTEHRAGTFVCGACGAPLFLADTKFESGSGWPSFFAAVSDGAVTTKTDTSHGMSRTEVTCTACGGHLGHVFEDGPQPTGLRYCINGLALDFAPKNEK